MSLVERRREQQDHAGIAPHQLFIDRRHRAPRALRIGRAGDDRPRLRDRIDLALVVLGRAERRAIVEIGAAIPVAVPGVLLDGGAQAARPVRGKCRPRPHRREHRPGRRNDADRSARTSRSRRSRPCPRRRPCSCRRSNRRCPSAADRATPKRRPCFERAHAMFVDRAGFAGRPRLAVVLLLLRLQKRRGQERHLVRRGWRYRRWSRRNGRRRTAATGNRR